VRRVPWNETYLLGWYDASGRPHLTTWMGEQPCKWFMVTGNFDMYRPPLWDAPASENSSVYLLSEDINFQDAQLLAAEMNGTLAIGWHYDDGHIVHKTGGGEE
jgi:hypothetical protein